MCHLARLHSLRWNHHGDQRSLQSIPRNLMSFNISCLHRWMARLRFNFIMKRICACAPHLRGNVIFMSHGKSLTHTHTHILTHCSQLAEQQSGGSNYSGDRSLASWFTSVLNAAAIPDRWEKTTGYARRPGQLKEP